MGWEETTEESTSTVQEGGPVREVGLGLAVVWCREEPWRVGEILHVGAGDRRVHIFGRGDDAPEEPLQSRLRLIQQRPGQNVVTPPLGSRKVSRVQLRIQRVDGRTLAIENLGKRSMHVRGREVHHALLRLPQKGQTGEGAVLKIDGELAFVLVERPAELPRLFHAAPAPLPGFGSPCTLGLVGESPVVWALRDQLALTSRAGGAILVHGGPGSGLAEVTLAAQRAQGRGRGVTTLDLATIPRDGHFGALFGDGPLGVQRDDLLLHGLETLEPKTAEALGKVLTEGRVPNTSGIKMLEIRVIGATTAPELLPETLRGAFHHLVRAPSLTEYREDLPFIALAIARSVVQREPLFGARFGDGLGLSNALAELLPQLPLEGGLPFLRAMLLRSLALSSGAALTVPPELEALGRPGLEVVEPPRERVPMAEPEARSTSPLPADLPPSIGPGLAMLTRAEKTVLQYLAFNMTSREIGENLFISVRTVQNHRARICEKLGLRGNNALLGIALRLREHLGPPDPR
jgi:DNA-binding CsgD family transcriptional regulator